VRSEGEFAQGNIPSFVNLPILNNAERAQVGTLYKQEGQDAAITLGHQLVRPNREARINSWLETGDDSSENQPLILSCWRGGLRSKTAAQWIREQGKPAVTIVGGYKAIRQELLDALRPERLPELWVITGLTGSGKTALLNHIAPCFPVLDLENLANHRGSSFGQSLSHKQPSQATFENAIGLEFFGRTQLKYLIEDESINLGSVWLPSSLKSKMNQSLLVYLQSPIEERVHRIFEEYLERPLACGVSAQNLKSSLLTSVQALRKKLGGALTQEISVLLESSFLKELPDAKEQHFGWIELLLTRYYDPLYQYGYDKQSEHRKVLFKGDLIECQNWISASLKQ
jgi:tRNA 2-selenouridine synthase